MRIQKNRVFLKTAAKDFKRIGAIAPSSAALGQAMTSEIARRPAGPVKVLEVGGGTGSITRVIGKAIKKGDHLDVYEIDAGLAGVIQDRLKWDKSFRSIGATVTVHNQPIEGIDRQARYNFIISCLPFTNFEPEMVREIFEIYRGLLHPGGVCSFFEYALLRNARLLVGGGGRERTRLEAVARVVGEYVGRYCFKRNFVLMNFPPALVHHICFTPAATKIS